MKSLLIRLIKKLGDMRRHLLYYRIWPAVYRRAAKKPIDEKKVLLASNSKMLPDNLSCMKRELEARGMHCTEMLIPAGAGSISARVAEFRQNIRFQREYATSKLVFVEDAFFPLFANHPRKGTEVIQLWHACGAFKKWGYSTADLKWGADRKSLERYPIHNTYTAVTVSARNIIPYYAEAFNCPERIIRPLGVPRTDIYFNPDATAVIVEQPPMFFKSQKKKRASGKKKKTTAPDNNPLTEQVALNYHSSHASLMAVSYTHLTLPTT